MQRLLIIALLPLLVLQCATISPAPEAPDQIMGALEQWRDGIKLQDLDMIMAVYSDSYRGNAMVNKDAIEGFMMRSIASGMFDTAEVNLDEVVIERNGDTATAGPVHFGGDWGYTTMEFTLANEDGHWRIVGSDSF